MHLGKAAAFRAGGVPLPRGATASDLGRLTALIAATGAAELVVLGDFLHAAAGRVDALDAAFLRWREDHRDLAITLVRGNHDARAGDPPEAWRVRVVGDPHPHAPFVLCHEPQHPRTGYALCGHVHPGIRLSDPSGDSARLPCFVLGRKRALLPAFGRLTGLALVTPAAGETIVAIAGARLFALPSRAGLDFPTPASASARADRRVAGADAPVGPLDRRSLRARPRSPILCNALAMTGAWNAATHINSVFMTRAICLSQKRNATVTVRRLSHRWTRLWTGGGTYVEMPETPSQNAVFVVVLTPYPGASKKSCQSPSAPLCFVFIRHLNTRYSRF